jgi:Zn-dependent protease
MLLSGLDPTTLLAVLAVIMIAFTFHEFAHAWSADFFGDDTPRMNGRLTLNPLAHLDLMGTLMMLFSFLGWAKPVPINPYVLQRRSPMAPMLVALAGPVSNFLMALSAAGLFRLGLISFDTLGGNSWIVALLQFLQIFGSINISLMLFNLIPLPPLDGHHIFEYFLPASWLRAIEPIWSAGPIILILLVAAGAILGIPILSWIIGPPSRALMSLLFGF